MQIKYGSAPRPRPLERTSAGLPGTRRRSYPAAWDDVQSRSSGSQTTTNTRRSSSSSGHISSSAHTTTRTPSPHGQSASGQAPLMNNRYKLEHVVGKGHFASVYKAHDTASHASVAIKMLGWEYMEDARAEQVILQRINEADKKGRKKVVKLLAAFTHQNYFCFVMPLLGDSLSKRRFGLREGNVQRAQLQLLAKQLAEALTFIHGKCALVHTDLKPDNILLDDNTSRGIGNGWTIADFGNAFFHIEGKDGTSLITTRPYRSPEVITKRGWRHPTDMWSLGCILYEVYVGRPLFGVNSGDQQHIALITSKLGAVPGVSYEAATRPPSRTSYFKMRFSDDPEFLDLLTGLFAYEPTQRLRAKEMCKHPFCNPGDLNALPYDAAMLRAWKTAAPPKQAPQQKQPPAFTRSHSREMISLGHSFAKKEAYGRFAVAAVG